MSLSHLFAKTLRVLLAAILLLGLALMTTPLPALAAPIAYAVRSDVDDQLYQIDLATGAATAIGLVGFNDVEGLAFDCAGNLFGVDDVTDQLIAINLATGAGTAVGPLGIGGVGLENDFGLAFDPGGNVWLSTDSPQNFYSINQVTGAATVIGAQGQPVTGLAASAAGLIYGLGGDLTNNLVILNTATGAATNVGPLGGAVSPLLDGGLEFDIGGTLWGLGDPTPGTGNPGQIFTINITTGAATLVATPTIGGLPAGGFEGLAINTSCLLAPTPTFTFTPTPTFTFTPTPTFTFTPTLTRTPGPSSTPLPTNTLLPTNPPPPADTPAPTNPPPAIVDPYLTKAADPQFARVGDLVQFTIIATNPNPVDLPGIVVIDGLPAELDFMNATATQGTFTFDAPANTITFNIGTLGPGQSATLVIQVRVNDKAQPGSVVRNVAVLNVGGRQSGQAIAEVQIVPTFIPVTGAGPGWREVALTALMALLASLLPWFVWRLRRQDRH